VKAGWSASKLFAGVTAVLYGYTYSSMVYFYVYIRLKETFNSVSITLEITYIEN